MVDWLNKLKALFNIEINSPLITVHITKDSNNQQKEYLYDKNKKKLEVFLNKLPKEKESEIKSVVQNYLEEKNKLLEINTTKLLHNLYKYNENNENKQILNFFEQIVPKNDFEALESALYLRYVFQNKGDINKLKKDIRQRFGDRGNNIANLCSAGYFEEFLIPLYNSSKTEFNTLYELIILKSVVAVFVNRNMKHEEITEEIKKRLEISKKYGINFIHIHGIGESNISKIKQCINENKSFFDFFEKEIYEKDGIIIIELLLK